MLNDSDSSFLLSQLGHNASLQQETAMGNLITEGEYKIFAMLKPKIYKDGNAWCVLYGDNIHAGICGFGETPYKAVLAFNKAWDSI